MEALGCLFVLAIIFLIIKAFVGKKDNEHIRQQQQQDETPTHWLVQSVPDVRTERLRCESNSFRIADCWIPEGQECTVCSYTIPGGMIYVGKAPSSSYRPTYWSPYPALIDTRLPIDEENPDRDGSTINYYYAYSLITPQARAGYLEWLINGRNDPKAPSGFPILYFYGLERRLLGIQDIHGTDEERNAILREVRHILSIYQDDWTLRRFASELIVFYLAKEKRWQEIAAIQEQFGGTGQQELPIAFRIGISKFLINGEPIPSNWALDWVIADPESHLRTPAHRCREEMKALFSLKYRERFGEGLVVKRNKSTLKIEYHPANDALRHGDYKIETDFPDVGKLKQPITKFRPLVDSCIDELDAYSRYLGRHPDDRESFPATALLPKSLLELSDNSRLVATKELLQSVITDDGTGFFALKEILNIWDIPTEKRIAKKDLTSLALLLEGLGFGMEPDPRFSGSSMKAEDLMVVFPWIAGIPSSPNSEYNEALLRLQISAMICIADQVVSASEERNLQQLINGFNNLTDGEKRRLDAHLNWFVKACPSRTGLLKKLEKLPENQKHLIADFLLEVARVDGNIDPEEVKLLSKLYTKMGLSEDELHSSIHQSFTRYREPTEPVTIKYASEPEEEYAVPEEAQKESGVSLDLDAIQRKMKETAIVTDLLQNIFTDDEPQSPSPIPTDRVDSNSIRGLSIEMSDFLRELGGKSAWSRHEIEELAQRLGLMPEGAIEDINDLAYDITDEPLVEEDEDLIINQEIYEELIRGENSQD